MVLNLVNIKWVGMKRLEFVIALVLVVSPVLTAAEPLLEDINADGQVFYLGFGDSITYGVGDGTQPGQDVSDPPRTDGSMGYVARIGTWLGIPVRNAARPGEHLTTSGILRFAAVVQGSSADVVGVLEGVNDAFDRATPSEYDMAYQRIVNVTLALGKRPLLITEPVPCCSHQGLKPYASMGSNQVRAVAARNELPYADVELAWSTTCENKASCELLCRPDGLHPNSKGYDVIAQVVAAALLDIDIFAEGGAKQLEDALGWPAGTVIVKPVAAAG